MRYWNVTGEGYHFNYSTNYTTKKYQHFNLKDCAGNDISVEGSSVKISSYVSNQILIRTEYNNLWTIHTLCSLHTKYLIVGFHSLMSDTNPSMKTVDLKGTQVNTQVDILAYVNHSYVTFITSEYKHLNIFFTKHWEPDFDMGVSEWIGKDAIFG